jgi:hypothetical protein
MRATRSYQSAAEAYDAAVYDTVENAKDARHSQKLADSLGAESLGRDAAAAVSAALQAVRKGNALQRQLERSYAHAQSLQEREAVARAQAVRLTADAGEARQRGDWAAGEKAALLATVQQNRAAHVAAQVELAKSYADELRGELDCGYERLHALVGVVEDKARLQRKVALDGMQAAVAEAQNAVAEAHKRATDFHSDAASARADAALLQERVFGSSQDEEGAHDVSKSIELIRSRATALSEDAEARDEAAERAEADKEKLTEHLKELKAEFEELSARLTSAPLLPDVLQTALRCSDPSEQVVGAKDSAADRETLLSKLVESIEACHAVAPAAAVRAAWLTGQRNARVESIRQLVIDAAAAKRDLNVATEAPATPNTQQQCAATIAVAKARIQGHERELTANEGALAEVESALSDLQRQAAQAVQHAKLLATLREQMLEAAAAVDAASSAIAKRRCGVNLHGAIADVTAELETFHAELASLDARQDAALARALKTIDIGDGGAADDAMAEVREAAARRQEVMESASELEVDLLRLQQHSPVGDVVRHCSVALL